MSKPTIILLLCLSCLVSTAQRSVPFTHKLSPGLARQFSEPPKQNQQLHVSITFRNSAVRERYMSQLQPVNSYKPTNTIVCNINSSELRQLLQDSEVIFADLSRKPHEELTTGTLDLSVNQINLAHHRFPDIRGNGIHASIKELLFDTTDVDISNRFFNTGLAATSRSTHASIMATTLAGAGNSSAFSKGAANGALLTSSDFSGLLPDDDAINELYHISIQNHSYGTGIENYYGADAAAYDASAMINPTLLHVFSSGNSGDGTSSDGRYAGISGVSNLTGNYKMAKNIITVGAVDSFGIVNDLSSRGPAYDGRIKPEVVAFGNDGTSGACAIVSGTAALLQQAYVNDHGQLPPSTIVKAILLVTANDKHHHISYASGFGNVNAQKALTAITAKQYTQGMATKNKPVHIALSVPAGCSQLKLIVVWNDEPAAVNSAKALVNDIDATLVYPSTGESWKPWVLNDDPDVNSLQQFPSRRTDSLNNEELITIDAPQSGPYDLQVTGNKLGNTQVPFSVAWQFDTADNFTWTYPTTDDVLQSGNGHIVKWQSTFNGNGNITYSINSGLWQTLATNVPLSQGWAAWNVPSVAAIGRIRMTFPADSSEIVSDEFVISPSTDLNVGFNCNDSFMLKWSPNNNSLFHVYELNGPYLQPVTNIADSLIIFQKHDHHSMYYTVVPDINGKPGLQSNLVNYTHQGVDCYIQNFYATLQDVKTLLEVSLGTLYNVKYVSFEKWNGKQFVSLFRSTSPGAPYVTFSDIALSKGENSYRSVIALTNGASIYSDVQTILYFTGQPVIIYPNPVRKGEPIRFIAQDPGVYAFSIHDLNGKLIYSGTLNDIIFNQSSARLTSGIYVVRISSASGNIFSQKLVVN